MMKALTPTLCVAAIAACSSGPETVHGPVTEIDFGPPLPPTAAQEASLWTSAPGSLLSMRRAKEIGDLLTVVVEMNDQAVMQSSLSRSRSSDRELNVNALFGLPSVADTVLPAGTSLAPGVDMERQSSLSGSGAVNRSEQIAFTLAARVVGVEPNGNLVIEGYQRTRVSNELRYLSVSGVIRTQDITRTNTVAYDKIAEANLSYVNTGDATGPTRPGRVARVLDRFSPF